MGSGDNLIGERENAASTGTRQALELREKDKARYDGKGRSFG